MAVDVNGGHQIPPRTSFSSAQRRELVDAAAVSRREALAESRRLAAIPKTPKSPVVRAAEHAQRAQQAKPLMAAITAAREHDRTRCGFCGLPSPKNDGVCPGHRDLGGTP